MIRRRAFLILSATLLTAMALSGPVRAGDAEEFIRNTGERAFESLGTNIDDGERAKRFRKLLTDTFDLRTIGRFVLGRYWRRASTDQRGEYIKLFEEFIVQAYSHRFKDLSGKEFRVGKMRDLNARDKLVLSEILLAPGKPPIRVNWRVRGPYRGYRVVDVTVEGVSMSVTQRDEFAAVIRRNGGKVEGLLTALRQKTGKGK